jgi:hypothetical protein
MQTLKIDESLRSLIPAPTKEELKLLTESIIMHGCRDALVTWKGIIIDGQNRYEICQTNEIPFKTVSMDFNNIEDVKEWMIKNQLSRRNLAENNRILLLGKLYNSSKSEKSANLPKGEKRPLVENQVVNKKINTLKVIAKENKTTEFEVKKAGKIATVFEALKKDNPELAKKVTTGEIKAKDILPKIEAKPEVKKERESEKKPETLYTWNEKQKQFKINDGIPTKWNATGTIVTAKFNDGKQYIITEVK